MIGSMCSNFQPIKHNRAQWVRDTFNCDLPPGEWKNHVWAMDKAPFILLQEGQPTCLLAKFGLEPHWAKSKPNFGRHTYNARSETVHEKPAFRSAWKGRQFGIVLADQFFEPYYAPDGSKPVWSGIHRANGQPTAIGSLWDKYINHDTGEVVYSFTMLTVNADHHPFMSQFHKPGDEKRSVVVLENNEFDVWLHANHDEARALIQLSADGILKV